MVDNIHRVTRHNLTLGNLNRHNHRFMACVKERMGADHKATYLDVQFRKADGDCNFEFNIGRF